MKKFLSAVVAIVIVTAACASVLASSYVGNANSRKFHYADCSMVGKMNPANKVFLNTREEAIAAGYVPCKRCKP
ncbi:MAG: nuclease [Selenomonadaceae bacterium]|nr:nuclease [Selenomonadaceae bacterium]MBQ3726402.1 nuclease [Selenomonadaceae bacterium]MBQ9496194.1 nuclease [Selenomonadaceae bacterium]